MRGGNVTATAGSPQNNAGPVDAGRCPLCGGGNQCAIVAQQAASGCWCMQADIPAAALAAIPTAALDRACLCPRCATLAAAVIPAA